MALFAHQGVAQQKGEREAERVDMIDRLTELDTKAAGTPEKKDASGKVTPAEPGILTLAEKNEREQLRETLGYTGAFAPDVAFSQIDPAPKAAARVPPDRRRDTFCCFIRFSLGSSAGIFEGRNKRRHTSAAAIRSGGPIRPGSKVAAKRALKRSQASPAKPAVRCVAKFLTRGVVPHGVAPTVWAAMHNPVLVRVMPKAEMPPDIGDESNQIGVAEKSAQEKAKDDERRLDLTALTFNADGDVAPDTLRQFVDSMPVAEQTGLRNPDGSPIPAEEIFGKS